jgi:RNA polymerase sigma-70 factor (ECF subfamily)
MVAVATGRPVTAALPATETDAAVIARSRRDPRAFAEIFDRHWPAIRAFSTSRAGAAGEDIAAEAFRIAFDERRRFDAAVADARPWLYGIATNLLRRHFRSAERERRATGRLLGRREDDVAEDVLGRVEAEQLGPQLAVALAALPAGDRDALLLLAWARLDYEQISLALDIPVGTVRSRIHRARTRVRAHLSEGDAR